MNQQTIATSLAPEVVIGQIQGNLQVKGWERPEISIWADPDDLNLDQQQDGIHVTCRSDCEIRLPQAASLRVESVQGNARFKLLEDQLAIEKVAGDLSLQNVAETSVDQVQGDLVARRVHGELHIQMVGGNASIRDVQGNCLIEKLDGNLDLRDVEGDLQASAAGNARLRLSLMSGDRYQVNAGGSVHCRLPEDASVKLNLSSGGQNIQVKLPNQLKNYQGKDYSLTLGEGDASMTLSAGGGISLSAQEAGWAESDEVDADNGEGFSGLPGDFGQRVARQVEAQIEAQMEAMTRQMNEHMTNISAMLNKSGLSPETTEQILQRARESSERAAARTQEKMQRAQEKLERKLETARRREESKAQAAERRAQTRGRRSWSFEWPASESASPAKEPVTDEERLMILRMLEQKKISLQEAEQLLAALEGKDV